MTSTALCINQAVKTYANGFTALKGVSFSVEPGEFFGLLGPNGAGKTTLISAMAGLSRLTSGQISICGHDVQHEANITRKLLGVVPQELVFDPFFSVREALRFQSGYFGLRKNDEWIDEIIVSLGLADKANTNTRNLSGGMKRRVMVALALVHRPPVIVLDEPTAGVDVELRQNLWQFITKLNTAGHTIILTTHYLEEAQSLCNRIAMLKHGEIVALDSTQNLLDTEADLQLTLTLDQSLPANLHQHLIQEDGNNYLLKLADYSQLATLLQNLQTQNINVRNLHIMENDLENVFLRLTSDHVKGEK
ncbi:MAG: ABC transporter ATP-binding protein [Snodgrassella sp.]|uniref:ABC transporter ATP-binding protein n=1 Tax=Snodgrassella TaxID=1193515 RepID=UPI00081607AB|nr:MULTISPECIES: ABC transporter ATP-binding protein [Snodgrassella]MCO6514110.1 ABC transporter ATP-binding protein [Snodgrassella sp.]MCO6514915.1 ABC transporter ATP-binding protein [Snodgrassella sp.]MCO6517985.1 ABC transporter ATP-binding protein [Snodgrassella sp.]MCO6521012.1 ABC transporter ATP-binding protein [Snodgrassella sp.]MCO6521956.1 ABC transporter ATP-binding protein [Snodgrassella sp.]